MLEARAQGTRCHVKPVTAVPRNALRMNTDRAPAERRLLRRHPLSAGPGEPCLTSSRRSEAAGGSPPSAALVAGGRRSLSSACSQALASAASPAGEAPPVRRTLSGDTRRNCTWPTPGARGAAAAFRATPPPPPPAALQRPPHSAPTRP